MLPAESKSLQRKGTDLISICPFVYGDFVFNSQHNKGDGGLAV
ncbi:hypothetical protein ANABIO32_12140 [Rossellomorea marisflavi]|nr:hypothetical protein ANABIO32_12140 [Rossellomorea marisflavi]